MVPAFLVALSALRVGVALSAARVAVAVPRLRNSSRWPLLEGSAAARVALMAEPLWISTKPCVSGLLLLVVRKASERAGVALERALAARLAAALPASSRGLRLSSMLTSTSLGVAPALTSQTLPTLTTGTLRTASSTQFELGSAAAPQAWAVTRGRSRVTQSRRIANSSAGRRSGLTWIGSRSAGLETVSVAPRASASCNRAWAASWAKVVASVPPVGSSARPAMKPSSRATASTSAIGGAVKLKLRM